MNGLISISGVAKSFRFGRQDIRVLSGIDFNVYEGDFVIIVGPSGCGKSTLLNVILGLEDPDSGKVLINNNDMYKLDSDKRAEFRHKTFGVVYQQANWVQALDVAENIAFPLDIYGSDHHENLRAARNVLSLFGLNQYENYRPAEISGGQQTKVAISRALITDPKIILADEPTGNLDSVSAREVMQMFVTLNQKYKRTIVMVTHNTAYERYANKVIHMLDGNITKFRDKTTEVRN